MSRSTRTMFVISPLVLVWAIGGYPVMAADTAGERATGETVAEGPRVDAGHFVNIATARLWRFRIHGVAPGQGYRYRITGEGADAIIGAGEIDTLPHEHPVDLRDFRKGWVHVSVEVLDEHGEPVEMLADAVYWDAAYPAGYL